MCIGACGSLIYCCPVMTSQHCKGWTLVLKEQFLQMLSGECPEMENLTILFYLAYRLSFGVFSESFGLYCRGSSRYSVGHHLQRPTLVKYQFCEATEV